MYIDKIMINLFIYILTKSCTLILLKLILNKFLQFINLFKLF